MNVLYDLIFLLISILYLPIYLFRRKFHAGFSARLGAIPRSRVFHGPIWIHAVSVGEALAVKHLVAELRKAFPGKHFVFSTVTPTGNKIVKTFALEGDFVTYLPLDFSMIVRKVIRRIQPSLFILAETEIWPNLISVLDTCHIPVVAVNARISDASFSGYRSIRFLLAPVLEKIRLFCVQSERDAKRLADLGVCADKIKVTGNMKFDGIACEDKKIRESAAIYAALMQLAEGESVWVAGSTHPGEEILLLQAYKELLAAVPSLKLVLAPRHPERAREVEKLIAHHGFEPVRISKLAQENNAIGLPAGRQSRVYILDTIGQLMYLYALARVVFVGGSMVKKGGHNILEPAMLEKPVLFGPYMFNFSDIAALFLTYQAARQVHSREELCGALREILLDSESARGLTQRAKELLLKNQGATSRNMHYIKLLFSNMQMSSKKG